MEITIQINGQAVAVEVSIEVYTYLDQAAHKDENLAHKQRRHRDSGIHPQGRTPAPITPELLPQTRLALKIKVLPFRVLGSAQPCAQSAY